MIAIPLTALILAAAEVRASDAPPELGRVHFERDFERASKSAREQKKPVFLLFQEIPGCATCKGFGAGPLSHPLLVEAIETLFVPVVVHNNAGGADAELLKRFDEPAWNNPVVRFLDASGRDLVKREDGVWTSSGIAARMIAALEAAKASVPPWLALARAELDERTHEQVVFAMHCFWEGQAALGAVDGVVDAKPAFLDGAEVVVVTYTRALALPDLVRKADASGCALRVWSADQKRVDEARSIVGDRARQLAGAVKPAKASHDLRHLKSARKLDLLPLTRAQALRVNAALASGRDAPTAILSPRQLELASSIERALARDAKTLDGLTRPHETNELAGYVSELERRLAR